MLSDVICGEAAGRVRAGNMLVDRRSDPGLVRLNFKKPQSLIRHACTFLAMYMCTFKKVVTIQR